MNPHPVTFRVTDDLRRTRLTVAFRLILAIPHLIWLMLWGVAAFLAAIGLWFGTLFTGRPPEGLHRFNARYLRYTTHVYAYLYILADPYPGFMADTEYPVDLVVAPPEPQNRLVTFFRLILAIPAFIVQYVLNLLAEVLSVIAWFIALFTARVPEGLRNLGLFCLRFQIQTNAYAGILTERYPSFAYDPPAPVPPEPTTPL
jgi:hypothetical protein